MKITGFHRFMFACCLAAQALNVQAGGNIAITAGQATQNLDQAHEHTNKGFLSKTTVTSKVQQQSTTAVGSTLQAAGGVKASQNKDPAFIQAWMNLTAKDPQFVQYQIDALVNQNLYPVVQELQKLGIDFNAISQAQKEAIFSAAVQHGAGTVSKTKGADNVLERALSIAQGEVDAPSFPTYTRQELVYGQVEDRMRAAEEAKAKIITQQLNLERQKESLITQRESLITQRESLITQQLNLERQKSQLLEKGLGSGNTEVQRIQSLVKALDQNVSELGMQVNELNNQITVQDQYIKEAAQYLKSQAQGSLADGEKWLKDFYQQRTQMYPAEAKRYKLELESLLKQYREEQKTKKK